MIYEKKSGFEAMLQKLNLPASRPTVGVEGLGSVSLSILRASIATDIHADQGVFRNRSQNTSSLRFLTIKSYLYTFNVVVVPISRRIRVQEPKTKEVQLQEISFT